MPGVTVRTATRSGPVNPPTPDTGRYYVVGQFERGPVTAQRIRSAAELAMYFGSPTGYSAAYDDLRTFFEEGGSEAYVTRVVGPAATKGTVTASDKAGSPLPTLRIDAASAGAWSANLSVVIYAGKLANTFSMDVLLAGIVQPLETRTNMASPAAAVAAYASSLYIRVVDLGSVTAAPNNIPAPATKTVTAGADDRASITATLMGAALSNLGIELGSGAVAIPGYSADLVGAALLAHAKTCRRLALLAPPVGQTEAQVVALADSLIGADGEFAGLFYPWVNIPISPITAKTISPEGYVAACRARAHREAGPWRAGAGAIAEARYILGPAQVVDRAQGDRLDEAGVNAIRIIAGTTRLYGWRSLSNDLANYALLTGRDVLNTIAVAAELEAEDLVFQPIDPLGHLFGKLQSRLLGIVEPMRVAGGLYPMTSDEDGTELDPGYSVDVGPTVNTQALAQANKIAGVVAVRVSPVGTLVDITVVKAGLTATV